MYGLGARLLVALVSIAGAAVPLRGAVQQDTSIIEAFVELRLFRGTHTIVNVLVRDSTILVSVPEFLNLTEIRTTTLEPGRRLFSVIEPENLRVGFDTESGAVRRGDSTHTLGSEQFVWKGRVLYAATQALARAYGIRMTVDWDDLRIVVRDSEQLPVARRLERLRRRAMLATVRSSARPAYALPVRQGFASGAVLDWAANSSTVDPFGTASLDLGFGTQMAGGSLEIRHRQQTFSGTHSTTSEASWSKAWSGSRWLGQLRVGDAFSTGRSPRRLRGVSLTNAPFVRPRDFATAWFDHPLPEGWELELYRSGRLIGFAGPDELDDFRFSLPVRYGVNPFELVAYGPQGEVRRFRRSYVVPSTRLPAGRFEYSLAAGTCTADPCRTTVNVDTRYGVSRRLTLQAGADFFWRDSLPNLWHPYGLVSYELTRSLNVTAEAVANASTGGRIEYVPSSDFEFTVEHVEFRSGSPTPLLGSTTLERRTRGFMFWRLAGHDQAPFVRLSAMRTEATKLRSASVRFSTTGRARGTHIEVGVERRNRWVDGLSGSGNTILDVTANRVLAASTPWLRSMFVRGRLAVDVDSGLTRAAALVARPITSDLRVELETGWERGLRGFTIDLTVVTAFPTARAVSHNRYTALDGIRGNQRIEGSVMWDRRSGRLGLGDGRSLGRAGISGLVFFDGNGNGRRDAAEAGVPNIRIRIGSKGERTDSLGRFDSWDLVPFEPVRLEIDSLSIANPMWVPATPVMSATPGPNSFTVVHIPLVRAGELSGRVTFADGTPIGGVRIDLVRAPSVLMQTTSFSDGAFSFFGIPPGRYNLQVSANHLDQLGATADSVSLVMDPMSGPSAIDDVIIRLTRNADLPPGQPDTPRPAEPLEPSSGRGAEPDLAPTEHEASEVRRLIARRVRFGFDRATIREGDDSAIMAEKVAILLANPNLRLRITGHADERGTFAYNLRLGFQRARTVRAFLIDRGIDESRITIASRGERNPIDTRHTRDAWSKNRRVEFDIIDGSERLRLPEK